MRMVVDFPAPLGPRNPTTWPRSTANETWSTAVTPSNRLETPSTERRGIQSRERVYRRSDANHIGPPSSSPPGPRRVVASISSRRRLFQLLGRTLEHVRRGPERLAGGLDLRVALGPVFLLDRLAHAWKRSEEHTSELQSRNDISYAVFCLKKKKKKKKAATPQSKWRYRTTTE